MSVTIPYDPPPKRVTPRYQSVRRTFRSPLTGKAQSVGAPGAYFGIDVLLPPLTFDQWRVLHVRLIEGLEDTVIYRWPQAQALVGAPGAPKVAGAAQSGLTLDVDGFAAGYTPVVGQYFSVVSGALGLSELKVLTAQPSLTSGAGEIAFRPHLRAAPADNADLEFTSPNIHGFLVDNRQAWTFEVNQTYGLSFSIEEAG